MQFIYIYIKSFGGQLGLVPGFGRRDVFRPFHFAIFDVFMCPWAPSVMDCDIAAVLGFHESLSFAASVNLRENMRKIGALLAHTRSQTTCCVCFPQLTFCFRNSVWHCTTEPNCTNVDPKQFKQIQIETCDFVKYLLEGFVVEFFFALICSFASEMEGTKRSQDQYRERTPLQSRRRRPHQPTPRRPGLRLHWEP